MIKPVGALCNYRCAYCYYLPTKNIYDNHESRMSLTTLESIIAGYIPHAPDDAMICWQGGEPTLAGLDFFQKAIELQQKYKRPSQQIANAIQTNGSILDDKWCDFFKKNQFLVGISIDGPSHLHNTYRIDNAGNPTYDQVIQGLNLLKKHNVEYNILCVLNDKNVNHPEELYNFLLNLGSKWLQFIPEVVWNPPASPTAFPTPADHCPTPQAHGNFLCTIFDLWFAKHRQRVSIRLFDAIINKLITGRTALCQLDISCHGQLTIEHNGDVFGCDHFVQRRWQLAQIGNPQYKNPIPPNEPTPITPTTNNADSYLPASSISTDTDISTSDTNTTSLDTDWFQRLDLNRLNIFAKRKQNLPQQCRDCKWLSYCYGGCPEHRQYQGDTPQPSYLCQGYTMFFDHSIERLQWLAGYLIKGQQPPPVDINLTNDRATDSQIGRHVPIPPNARIPRNAPCPCGSGLKYKNCCGKSN